MQSNTYTIYTEAMICLTAFVQRRGTGVRDEGSRESREISVEAETYAEAKRSILEQLPDGWVVGSFRVA